MDVRETDAALTFTADVPGVKLEDLSVEIDERDRVLIVRGKREETTEEDVETPTTPKKKKEEIEIKKAEETAAAPHQRTYHRRERHFGSFENRYALPFNAELDAIDAKVDHGVLKITVPKRRPKEGEAEVRSIHWFPYDRVGEVNADP
jgi:HSP20 family protein